MEKNVGGLDRGIRLVLAILFAALAYAWNSGPGMWTFAVLAALMLVTSLTGFCLPYRMLGINTRSCGCGGGCKSEKGEGCCGAKKEESCCGAHK
jgi:hypothetical protein